MASGSKLRFAAFVAAGLAVAVLLALAVSPEASSDPDGLQKVADEEGFAEQEEPHDLDDSPLAGYGVDGVDDDRLSTGLSGAIGVALTFALAGGGFVALRRLQDRRSRAAGAEPTERPNPPNRRSPPNPPSPPCAPSPPTAGPRRGSRPE